VYRLPQIIAVSDYLGIVDVTSVKPVTVSSGNALVFLRMTAFASGRMKTSTQP